MNRRVDAQHDHHRVILGSPDRDPGRLSHRRSDTLPGKSLAAACIDAQSPSGAPGRDRPHLRHHVGDASSMPAKRRLQIAERSRSLRREQWLSTKPGMTTRPCASNSSALPASARGPRALSPDRRHASVSRPGRGGGRAAAGRAMMMSPFAIAGIRPSSDAARRGARSHAQPGRRLGERPRRARQSAPCFSDPAAQELPSVRRTRLPSRRKKSDRSRHDDRAQSADGADQYVRSDGIVLRFFGSRRPLGGSGRIRSSGLRPTKRCLFGPDRTCRWAPVKARREQPIPRPVARQFRLASPALGCE